MIIEAVEPDFDEPELLSRESLFSQLKERAQKIIREMIS